MAVHATGKALSGGVNLGLRRLRYHSSRLPRVYRAPYHAAPAVASPNPASARSDVLLFLDMTFLGEELPTLVAYSGFCLCHSLAMYIIWPMWCCIWAAHWMTISRCVLQFVPTPEY